MQKQLDNINETIAKMQQIQSEQSSDIKIIKDAITGSDLNPNGVTNRLEKLENFADKAKKHGYIGAGIVIAIASIKAGWDKIADWISHLI